VQRLRATAAIAAAIAAAANAPRAAAWRLPPLQAPPALQKRLCRSLSVRERRSGTMGDGDGPLRSELLTLLRGADLETTSERQLVAVLEERHGQLTPASRTMVKARRAAELLPLALCRSRPPLPSLCSPWSQSLAANPMPPTHLVSRRQ
jgi:hypothetical protein